MTFCQIFHTVGQLKNSTVRIKDKMLKVEFYLLFVSLSSFYVLVKLLSCKVGELLGYLKYM